MIKTWAGQKRWEPTSVPFWQPTIFFSYASAITYETYVGIVHPIIQFKTWFWWLFLSILMNLAAAPDDASCITQCGMLRALLEATGCRLRASIGAVSPRRLPWSSILLCGAEGHKTQLFASTYHTKRWTDQLGFFANQRIIETWTILMTNVPYYMWRPNDVKIL